jgi:type II secretory ATPase GspE/PulE/Tfp pilus assembly ATPase PilB-like protein
VEHFIRLPVSRTLVRLLLILVAAGVIVTVGADVLLAQSSGAWPELPLPDLPSNSSWRGPGNYLSWVKLLGCWLLFLLWVWSTDWVNRDLQEHGKLDYVRWNSLVFGTFMAGVALLWVVPSFWVDFGLLIAAYAVPLFTYIIKRNALLDPHERVCTPDHIRFWLAERLKKLGVKIEAEKAAPHESGPPIKLLPRGGATEVDNNVRLLSARQSPGFVAAREILLDAIVARATAVMLDFTQQTVAVNFMIDGVWLGRDALERASADQTLETLKLLCGLNAKERRSRQEGTFAVEHTSLKYQATLSCQGTQAGERAVVQFEEKKVRYGSLEELGMRSKLQESLLELIAGKQGLVLFAAPPANGLRTTMNVSLRCTDRLTREFLSFEEETNRYEEIENIPAITYRLSDELPPAGALQRALRMEPHVAVVRDLVDAEMVRLLCDAAEERLVIGSVRAKDSAESLLRVLSLGTPAALFAKSITAVLSQRLVRKLCESCKEAYTPPPEVLKQLGIPPDRVQTLYQPPQPNPQERRKPAPCKACGAIGYVGRTAIFELLPVGENVRKVLATSPKLELLRAAARRDGMRSLQEEGVVLVAKGVTSLQELMRVLKQ